MTAPGWTVHTADTPIGALRCLSAETIHVIVSDLMMPMMSGADLTHEVLLRYPWVIRIILSGRVDAASVSKGSQWSERYLTKPCALPELCEQVRQAISCRDQDRARMPKRLGASDKVPASILPSVLQIDHCQEAVRLLGQAFDATGSRIDHRSMPDALAALADLDRLAPTLRPDVIVLDLKSPQMNAYEFLTRYRLTVGSKVPVIATSDAGEQKDLDDAVRHGAASYRTKPRTWEQYLEMARSVARYATLVSRGASADTGAVQTSAGPRPHPGEQHRMD